MVCCDPKYSPSALRHRIEFQSLALAPNDSGGQVETWSTFAEAWASITPKVVKEVNFAQRIEPRIMHEIICRYVAGITATMRVKFGARYFEIKSVIIKDEIKEWLIVSCEERTGT